MAIIVQILLQRGEVDLACFVTAQYEIQLDEVMYIEAIDNNHY